MNHAKAYAICKVLKSGSSKLDRMQNREMISYQSRKTKKKKSYNTEVKKCLSK